MQVYTTDEQISTSSNEDNQSEQTDNVASMPVVCAWHEEYVEGSTSTICDECKAKYFPGK